MYFPKTAVPLNQTPQPTTQPVAQPKTGYMPKSAVPVQPEKIPTGFNYWKGVAKNALPSVGRMIGDVGKAAVNIFNPNWDENTLYNIGKVATGVAQKFTPGVQKEEEVANAVGNYYKDRYGGLENIKKSFYNDPAGVGLDVATVLQGTGGLLKGGAGLATRGATEVSLTSNAARLGRAGSTLTKVGGAIDPLTQTGRAVRAVTQPVRPLFSKAVSSAADFLGSKAQKFNKTDITAIKEATGMNPLEYARSENLPIAATNRGVSSAQEVLSNVQKEYNSMVRQGKAVSRKDYVNAIKQEAQNVLNSGDTPSNRAIAQKLLEEAKYQASKKTPMTDEFLADTKTSAFSQASKNQINNPMVSGVEEKLGRAGVETLEKVAPGSKATGKRLRGLREYTTRLESQANTGKGTQFFNLFKPVGAGLLTGAGLGSFAPGVGNVAGAVVGATAAAIANSPQFLSFASRSLTGLSKAKLPAGYSKLFSRVINASKAGRLFTPTSQESQLIESLRPQLEQKQSSDPIIQPSVKPYQVPKIRRPNGR